MNAHPVKTALFAFLLLSFLLCARGAFAATAEEAAPDAPQPQLLIETPAFDLGDIKPGAMVEHEFVLKNQGQADLELIDVRPGCGCTVVTFDKIIPPGTGGRLLMKVRVYREWAGQDISKSVWLISNDPLRPQSALTLSGQVLPR